MSDWRLYSLEGLPRIFFLFYRKALNGIGADGVWEKDSLDIRAEAWKEYFLLRRLFSSLKVFASSIIYVCALSIFKEGLKVYVTYSTRGHNLS